MGCPISKNKQSSKPGEGDPAHFNDSEPYQVYTMGLYDQKYIAKLKSDIKEDIDVFLLNNILLSVMFFENYELEMAKAKQTVSRREQEMSLQLMADHNKQCIMPDTAVELVNNRVRYRWRHGPKKNLEESLISQRMYIVYDTIEILKESEDLDHYSGIDKPTYRAHVEKSRHPGFVKLRHPEYQPTASGTISRRLSLASTDTYITKDNGSPDDSQPSTSRNTLYSPEDDQDYARVTALTNLQPLENFRWSNNSSGIPSSCLKSVKQKNLEHMDETDDLYIVYRYFSSREIMRHFTNGVFPNLAPSLGFTEDEISNTYHNVRAVYCDTKGEHGDLLKCEVQPCVLNPWPRLNVWANRSRPIVKDLLNSMVYQWPTTQMVQEATKLQAVVVPIGYLQKRGKNPDYNLEWEVKFPKAEKYIHTRMSHAQMKCYLFMATLFKTFIEPVTQERGLLLDHIRTLMYWECEKNFRDWPENRLGEKMLRLLRIFSQAIGRRELADYFNESKNVFETVPGTFLFHAQEKLHNVCERPVAHFICALRNLNYSSKRFYPMLDFEELYKLLKQKNSMQTVNPAMYKAHVEDPMERIPRALNQEQLWIQRQLKMNNRIKQTKEKLAKQNLIPERRESQDSIDLKYTGKGNVDGVKAVLIIKFFIAHFLKIAKKSMKYHGATSQALFYLKHAWYLTKVMEDPMIPGEIYSRDLQKEISELEEQCKELCNEQPTPTTPVRNSVTQIQVQVVKGTTIDRNNINQQYQKGLQLAGAAPSAPVKHSSSWVQQNQTPRRNTKVRINSIAERII